MKFNRYEERKQHPQAGMIPDCLWARHFYYYSIDDALLKLMSLSEEELCEELREIELSDEKTNIFIAIICSHKNLRKNALNIIINKIGIDCVKAFWLAAECGRIEILQYLDDLFPNTLQDMIKANDYCVFREAAENGHLEILEYLETKIQPPATLQDMIKWRDYGAFRDAACNGHMEILEYLETKIQPKTALQEMIKANNYAAFILAACNGHMEVLEYLETKIQPQAALQDMIKANNYEAFISAVVPGPPHEKF